MEQNMGKRDEVAVDSCDSERTMIDDFFHEQAQDDALESESAMVTYCS
jgi:hypothetical protein